MKALNYLVSEMSMKEFAQRVKKDPVAILPIGALEGHSSHLPLSTDSIQPQYVAEEVAKRHRNAIVFPLLPFGNCSSTRNLPCTISVTATTLEMYVSEVLCEMARHGIRKIVVLSGHAGRSHMAALRNAAEIMLERYFDVKIMVLSDYDIAYDMMGKGNIPKSDGHAGTIETSRVWAIRPELVDAKHLPKANDPVMPKYMVLARPETFFPSGVIGGDPQRATKEIGNKVNKFIVDQLLDIMKNLEE
jgi:creatinine amidohydrolase